MAPLSQPNTFGDLSVAPTANPFAMGQGFTWQGTVTADQGFHQILDDAFQNRQSVPPPKTTQSPASHRGQNDAAPVKKRSDSKTAQDEEAVAAVAVPVFWDTPLPNVVVSPTSLAATVAGGEQPGLVTASLAGLAGVLTAQAGQSPAGEPMLGQVPVAETLSPGMANPAALAELQGAPPPVVDGPLLNPVATAEVMEDNQATLPQLPMGPGKNLAEPVVTERISVVLAEDAVLGSVPRQAPPNPDTPALPLPGKQEAVNPGLASLEAQHNAFDFSSFTANGFTNGFSDSSGIVAGSGVASASSGGVASSTSTAGGGGPRPALSATVTGFPDVIASELGRTRIITRPNQPEQIRIQMDPQELGELDMQVRVGVDRQVHMMITTQSEQTKELLQQQMDQLREALSGQDLIFGDVRVEVGARGRQGEAWRNARQDNARSPVNATTTDADSAAPPVAPKRSSAWSPGKGISIHV